MFLRKIGIHNDEIEHCFQECKYMIDNYLDWEEAKFTKLVLEHLKDMDFDWEKPTYMICEAMLQSAQDIAKAHDLDLTYENNGMKTIVWIDDHLLNWER